MIEKQKNSTADLHQSEIRKSDWYVIFSLAHMLSAEIVFPPFSKIQKVGADRDGRYLTMNTDRKRRLLYGLVTSFLASKPK